MIDLRRLPQTLGRPALLQNLAILIVGSLVCLGLAGYFQIDTAKPARLDADHLFLLTMAKSYINGHGFRFDAQLGYPDVRDSLYFPSFELSYRVFLWLATRITHNPFRAAHALYIAGISAMFGTAYWSLSRLGIRRWLAFLGAVSTVITPFFAHRIFSHDTLALSFAVPLGFCLAVMLGTTGRGDDLKTFLRDPFTIATIVVVGASGLYYAFYTLMFLAFAGVTASAIERRWLPLLKAACVGAPLFGLLIYSGYGLDLFLALSSKFAGPHRYAYEQILYGLDLPSMAYPFENLAKVAHGVAETTAALPKGPLVLEGEGEWPAEPLMLVLLGAPLIAAICLGGARQAEEAVALNIRQIGFCAILIAFGLLFGARGGLGYIFNLVFSSEIRADGRLMPFLSFAAVATLCLVAELFSRADKRWFRSLGQIGVALLLLVSVKPAIGGAKKIERFYMTGPLEQRLRDSTPLMIEAKNRADLRTVLELPTGNWPESPFIQILDLYEHQLPYIYDKPGSPTRWSYGATAKQPWFGLVDFATREPQSLAAHARALGFDSILIQKRGYEPARLAEMQTALSLQLAPACRLYEDDVEVLYVLQRSAHARAC